MNRPGTSISKAKVTKAANDDGGYGKVAQQKLPTLQDYIKLRDWVGAVATLESERNVNIQIQNSLWLAYCYFHMGEYRKAINIYDELLKKTQEKEYHIYKACCYYALCQYDDARREALKGAETPLQTRLLFHLAHKKNDEKNLMHYHQKLEESASDQLTLAAIHYLRGHYEEATEIYKKLLLESRKYEAINVYIALCYYKLEYYDVSLEILSGYQTFDPESVFTANLKACNNYQVYSGKNAEQVLRPLQQKVKGGGDIFKDSDLLRHNLVVFRNGHNAIQTLPPLLDVFPEARLNMVIYNLKNDNFEEAFTLVKDLDPTNPREYIIKAVAYLMYGQKKDSKEHLKTAQQLFQMVGASATECDTIPGRQCMASCFFLLKQFDDVLVYLNSIKSYFQSDDDFNWNYALALAFTGDYKASEAAFLAIRNEKHKTEDCYLKWLIRTYIMTGKPKNAWQVYMAAETTPDSFNILQIIANDCYKMGHFYYSMKAFESLDKLDAENDYEDGLRGSVVGVFQMTIAGKESVEHLIEAAVVLKSAMASPNNEIVIKVIKKWGKDNNLDFEEIGL